MPQAGRPQAHLCRPACSSLHRNLNILLPAPLHQEPALLVRDRPPVESLRLADLFSAQLQRYQRPIRSAPAPQKQDMALPSCYTVNVLADTVAQVDSFLRQLDSFCCSKSSHLASSLA